MWVKKKPELFVKFRQVLQRSKGGRMNAVWGEKLLQQRVVLFELSSNNGLSCSNVLLA
jgi:hypothetical protein